MCVVTDADEANINVERDPTCPKLFMCAQVSDLIAKYHRHDVLWSVRHVRASLCVEVWYKNVHKAHCHSEALFDFLHNPAGLVRVRGHIIGQKLE